MMCNAIITLFCFVLHICFICMLFFNALSLSAYVITSVCISSTESVVARV